MGGNDISCGCKRPLNGQTHGATDTPTWQSWRAMKDRCDRKKNPNYKYYGARGITVCSRWRKFENFLADMGERPENMTIDRIDNDKGYEPENCRWVNDLKQSRNRRHVKMPIN